MAEIVATIWDRQRQTWAVQSRVDAAILAGKQAVNTLQAMRASNLNLEQGLQKSFLRHKEEIYRALADLLISQGRLPEAEQVLAMLKEEELFEFIRRDPERAAGPAVSHRGRRPKRAARTLPSSPDRPGVGSAPGWRSSSIGSWLLRWRRIWLRPVPGP